MDMADGARGIQPTRAPAANWWACARSRGILFFITRQADIISDVRVRASERAIVGNRYFRYFFEFGWIAWIAPANGIGADRRRALSGVIPKSFSQKVVTWLLDSVNAGRSVFSSTEHQKIIQRINKG